MQTMKTTELTATELNAIQAEWMALDAFAPEEEKKRIFRLMERYPTTYVSGHDGRGVCIHHGQPLSMTVPFSQAMAQCKQLGGLDRIAWNGSKGEWYTL